VLASFQIFNFHYRLLAYYGYGILAYNSLESTTRSVTNPTPSIDVYLLGKVHPNPIFNYIVIRQGALAGIVASCTLHGLTFHWQCSRVII